MKKLIFTILFLLTATFGFAQLVYSGNGNIRDAEEKRVSPNQVRDLLAKNTTLLESYNIGRTKKTAGNIIMLSGFGMIAADLLIALNADVKYPGALTVIGGLAVVIAIPVKIGYAKRIRTSIDGYNKEVAFKHDSLKVEDLSICSNSNGIGLQITF